VSSWTKGVNPYSRTFTHIGLSFTYPPMALVVLWPLSWAPFRATQWIMWLVSIGAGTVATWIVLQAVGCHRSHRLWCAAVSWACISFLLLEPARSGLDYGQIEAILMVAVLVDAIVIPREHRGFVIGFVSAVKLTPLVFILVLLVDRDWRSSIRAGATFLGLSVATWLVRPNLSQSFWIHDVLHPARVGGIAYAGNQSLFAILHRAPFPAGGSMVGWLLASAVTLSVGTYIAWQQTKKGWRVHAVLAIALVGQLVSPISWTHHWVWLILVPPMLVAERQHSLPGLVRSMLWVLVGLAVLAPYWWFTTGTPSRLLDSSLTIWAFLTLVGWATAEACANRTNQVSRSVGVDVYAS
jgi:alpha-1,2-mannosyltransferase